MDSDAWLIALAEASPFFDEPFAGLSAAEQVFVAIWALEGDVNNGGFDQYYFNSSGDYALVVPDALRRIGAEQTAAIVEQANAVWGPSGPPPDYLQRRDLIDDLERERWDPLDQAFYAYPDNLTTLLYDFVQANRAEVRGA